MHIACGYLPRVKFPRLADCPPACLCLHGLPSLQVPAGPIFCGATWFLGSQYVFSGPLAGEAQAGFDEIAAVDPAFQASIDEAADVWDLVYNNMIEFISPAPWGGELSSIAVNETLALHAGIVAQDARLRPQPRPLTNSSGGASMWSPSDVQPSRSAMVHIPGLEHLAQRKNS